MKRHHFEPHAGSVFHVTPEEGKPAVALKLIEVKELPTGPNQESFSLIFSGPNDRFLAQRTYEFSHKTLETMPIFIVPIGRGDDGYRYQAVFNRMVKP